MKRILIATTAAFLVAAPAAWAQTADMDMMVEDRLAIYAPDVDTSMLTSDQLDRIRVILTSSVGPIDAQSRIDAIVSETPAFATRPLLVEGDRNEIAGRLGTFAPEIDTATLTGWQLARISTVLTNGGENSDMINEIQAIVEEEGRFAAAQGVAPGAATGAATGVTSSGSTVPMGTDPFQSIRAQLEIFSPGIDTSGLTEAQLNQISVILSSGDSPLQKQSRIDEVVNAD